MLGERGGNRTHDPLIKSQMLYLLSYALSETRERLQPRLARVKAIGLRRGGFAASHRLDAGQSRRRRLDLALVFLSTSKSSIAS